VIELVFLSGNETETPLPESAVPRYQSENGDTNYLRAAEIRGPPQGNNHIFRRTQAGLPRGHAILSNRTLLDRTGREIRMG
jgi:hypothetical protein